MDESNKRQRTTSSNNELHIKDLPDGLLVGISSYLAKPSVALFAIAMSPNNSQSQQTKTSKAIIFSIDWNLLDFSDIEKSLTAKLLDDDIDKILKSIDAVNNVRILKLGGCVNITGSGLDMLRSSIAIQQIDMSLVGKHEVPLIEPEPLLSDKVVFPVLHSIINGGSSLKHIEFPKKWRNAHSVRLTLFLDRYDDYLRNREHCCPKCNRVCVLTGNEEWIESEMNECYGTQNYTCSGCLKHFCDDDDCVDEDGTSYAAWCKKCEKLYCKDCTSISTCSQCRSYACNECYDMKECEGEDCGRVLCNDCCEKKTCHVCNRTRCRSCISSYQCSLGGCNKAICGDCLESTGEGGRCSACSKDFCSTECRYLVCDDEDGTEICVTCLKTAASDFRSKLQECKKENEELCQGMDDLYKKYMNVDGDGDN